MDWLREARGSWVGTSSLHMEWVSEGEKVSTAPSDLLVEPLSESGPVRVTYHWTHEGVVHRGEALIAANGHGGCVLGWVDTWHQASDVMRLEGPIDERSLSAAGTYQVEGYPDWGWRIEAESGDGAFWMRMFNVTPEGEASWAVRAEYRRA